MDKIKQTGDGKCIVLLKFQHYLAELIPCVSTSCFLKYLFEENKIFEGTFKTVLELCESYRVIRKDTLDSSYKSLSAESGTDVENILTIPANQLHS